ncbi:MAG: thioredoxin family protein [Planctomycetes bacterium]|nr:thioredoxin family protein [Planctomycetota bacterium]
MPRLPHPVRNVRLPGVGRWVVRALVAVATAPLVAGTFNPDRDIGDVVPAWTDLPGTDGKLHGWSEVADRDAVVVVFTCNSCPYAVDYEERINDLARRAGEPGSRFAVVAINCNTIPADGLEAMKQRAAARGFRFPYLFDASQETARAFGAVRTPEFFVLDRQRRIVAMGAMDDATDPAKVTRRYVDEALAALLDGRVPEVAETAPVGCSIRFARRRRGDPPAP